MAVAEDLREYLAATPQIDAGHPSVIRRAEQIVRGSDNTRVQAARLFYFVRDAVAYYPYTPKYRPEDYRASVTLARGQGYCVQKAVLLTALCRAAGIPARLHFVDIRSHRDSGGLKRQLGTDLLIYHGYTEINIEGQWRAADAALSQEVCESSGITPVEFDGTADADYHAHNRERLCYDLVTDHGTFQDLPWQHIMDAMDRDYGPGPATAFKRGPGSFEPPQVPAAN